MGDLESYSNPRNNITSLCPPGKGKILPIKYFPFFVYSEVPFSCKIERWFFAIVCFIRVPKEGRWFV
jgi:hypothetical protein